LKVSFEYEEWVDVGVLFFGDDNMVAFKERICFMGRKMEVILVFGYDDSGAFSNFFPVSKFDVVGKS